MWSLIKLYVAKKAITFFVAYAYGIKRLYRRSLELNNALVKNSNANRMVRNGIRHTFHFVLQLTKALDLRGWIKRSGDRARDNKH